jgi:hypothetical protein
MNAILVKQALEKVLNPNVLVNLVSSSGLSRRGPRLNQDNKGQYDTKS